MSLMDDKALELERILEDHPYTRISVALAAMNECFQNAKTSNLDQRRIARSLCRVFARKFQSMADEFSIEEGETNAEPT